jgi:ferredoxin, 2Fe-2S
MGQAPRDPGAPPLLDHAADRLEDLGVPAAMPKITYIEHGGREHRIEVPVGRSVMRGAVDNDIPGIDADCGGECACATCHVYVDAPWLAAIGTPVPGSQEASMLSFAALARPDSRLSCQITVNEALDGLVVRLPEGQH